MKFDLKAAIEAEEQLYGYGTASEPVRLFSGGSPHPCTPNSESAYNGVNRWDEGLSYEQLIYSRRNPFGQLRG